MAKLVKKFITEIPLTTEARERFVENLFDDDLPHKGEIFLPDDDFYIGANPTNQAENMIKLLGKWLGIKPGYIGLEFENTKNQKVNSRKYNVFIEQTTLDDEFVLGATIAYALTRYLVEERKQILPTQLDQQSALIANATIEIGLGLVILNGLKPNKFIQKMGAGSSADILRGFSQPLYSQMLIGFTHKYRLDRSEYLHCLTPWASESLGLKLSKHPTLAVLDAKHSVRAAVYKFVGLTCLLFIVLGVGIYVSAQKIKPVDKNIADAQEKVVMFEKLVKECESKLAYDRQYTDLSDIFAEKVLNATELRCQSLKNGLSSAEIKYTELLKK